MHGSEVDFVFCSLIYTNTGEKGNNGDGGPGGQARNGLYWNFPFFKANDIIQFDNWTIVNQAKNGTEGINEEGIQPPVDAPKFVIAPFIVSRYKAFMRDKLPDNVQESVSKEFLMFLEENDEIRSLYKTISIIDDFKLVDNQAIRLSHKIDFLPIVESLEHRIQTYAKGLTEQNNDNRVAMQILFTSILSKLVNLKTNENRAPVVNLPGYLEIVQENIEKLRNIDQNFNIMAYKEEYKKSLDAQINKALELVEKEILPEIAKNLGDIGASVVGILDEIKKQIEDGQAEVEQLQKSREKLQQNLVFNSIISVFRIVGAVAEYFGPIGNVFSQVVGIGIYLAENIYESSYGDKKYYRTQQDKEVLEKAAQEATESTEKAKTALSEESKLFKEQLKDILETLKKHNFQDVNVMKGIEEIKTVVDKLNGEDANEAKIVHEEKEKATALLGDIDEKIKKFIDPIMTVGLMGYNLYKEIRQGQADMLEIDTQIQAVKDKIKTLENLRQRIIIKFIPMVKQLENYVTKITTNLQNNSPIELDILKWKIQRHIREIKEIFDEVTEGYDAQEGIRRNLEKLVESLNVLINVYDRIDSYNDKAKFAYFFGRMIENQRPEIDDPELNKAVMSLNKVVQSNLILEQHQLAIHAFKQQQFPFGQFILSTFDFPTEINPDNTELLLSTIAKQIESAKNTIKQGEMTIGKYDPEIFRNIKFGREAKPFYQWDNKDVKDEVNSLFKLDTVILRSDIRKGLVVNAVKFKEIQLKFIASDQNIQNELNVKLKDYNLIMEMVGNGFYKCGDRFYYISLDENIILEYSLRSDEPSNVNEVYRKIKENAYFISPYALWKVKVVKSEIKAQPLDEFIDKDIHLELFGNGAYFKNGQYVSEICTSNLDKFYHYDGPTATSAASKRFNFIYSLSAFDDEFYY